MPIHRELSKVLKPLDPSVDPDSDDVPEFGLQDASVHDKQGNLTSLLLAKENVTLTITGRLSYSSKLSKHCESFLKLTAISN
jgi:hypothetical protein